VVLLWVAAEQAAVIAALESRGYRQLPA